MTETDSAEVSLQARFSLPWQGIAMQPSDLALIGTRSSPIMFGIVGSADAGKTSFLCMLFRLLLNGWRFENWLFSGSYTLSAWESLAQHMVLNKDNQIPFPPPTPSNPDFYSLYHIALRYQELFRDLIFADSSGEVFKHWATDRQDSAAENARWIYQHADAFVFFIDCEALVNQKAKAVIQVRQMAEQLAAGLNERPVMVVWSKADRLADVKEKLRQSLEADLNTILSGHNAIKISNFPTLQPKATHYNNHLAVVSTLLARLAARKLTIDTIKAAGVSNDDYFLNYRGRYV